MASGIAGDMLLAALLDLGGDRAALERDLLALGVGPIRIACRTVHPSGITALQVDVEADQEPRWHQPEAQPGQLAIQPVSAPKVGMTVQEPHPPHRPYRVIRELLARAPLPARVVERAQRVFAILAAAEGKVHGVPADEVGFHEVGALDAIADVVGCCLLLEQLGIGRVIAGPVLPGEGTVRCAHGRMPVPVPAVAVMLADHRVPQRRLGRDTGELTTPTGCALVIGLAERWLAGDGWSGTAIRVGHGAGHKTIPDLCNVLRCHLLQDEAASDAVAELRCQVDDATGEQLAMAVETLLAAGARDAYLAPIVMKKGRPGHELTVLCAPADRERMAGLVLAHTPTIGLRWSLAERTILPRRSVSVMVQGHALALKVVTLPDGSERAKPEADDVAALARVLGLGFAAVQQRALDAWRDAP
jgi:hypothetical protein